MRPITTSEQALEEAIRSEETAKLCGPQDPFYKRAVADVDFWLETAVNLENIERKSL